MKRIILSLLMIVTVAGVTVGATVAYFSDTETSTNNTFAAGTIDIAVNDENAWEETVFDVTVDGNLKPGMSRTATLTVANVGQNDLVLWKRVKVTDRNGGDSTEPEETADPSDSINNLDSQISYDMTVGGVNTIPAIWGVKLADVDSLWIPLGKVVAGDSVDVTQVYKLLEETGNEYQGDTLTFDIDLYAEQMDAPGPEHTTRGVVLENKDTTDWFPIMDGTLGILTWDVSGNYTLKAFGLTGGVTYRFAQGDPEVGISAYMTPTAGNLTITGNYGGFATPNTKYWLRPNDWDNAKSLWESNLVN